MFEMQMFGIDEKGQIYCVFVENFKPFFFVKVGDSWGEFQKFQEEIRKHSVCIIKIHYATVDYKKKKLYGFDNEKNITLYIYHLQQLLLLIKQSIMVS